MPSAPPTGLPAVALQLRTAAGHSRADAARLVGVTRAAWSHWELGDRTVRVSALELYAIKTNQQLTFHRLLGEQGVNVVDRLVDAG